MHEMKPLPNIEEMIKKLFKRNTSKKCSLFQKPIEEIHQFEKKFHYFSLHPLIGKVKNEKEGSEK